MKKVLLTALIYFILPLSALADSLKNWYTCPTEKLAMSTVMSGFAAWRSEKGVWKYYEDQGCVKDRAGLKISILKTGKLDYLQTFEALKISAVVDGRTVRFWTISENISKED